MGNNDISNEFINRYGNNTYDYCPYLILLAKSKKISNENIKYHLKEILLKSPSIDIVDFIRIIIKNPYLLKVQNIFNNLEKANNLLIKTNPMIVFESLIVSSLFLKSDIDSILEDKNFISNNSSYYDLAGFAFTLSKYGFVHKSNELIKKSLSLINYDSEHRHFYYCAQILMNNGEINLSKKLCEKAYYSRKNIKKYLYSYLLCKNMEENNFSQLGMLWNNTNLIFQEEQNHFCDYDYISRF